MPISRTMFDFDPREIPDDELVARLQTAIADSKAIATTSSDKGLIVELEAQLDLYARGSRGGVDTQNLRDNLCLYFPKKLHEDRFKSVADHLAAGDARTERANWEGTVALANSIRKSLDYKPEKFKKGYKLCPGGILNAFREGDLNFNEAVEALENWHKSESHS